MVKVIIVDNNTIYRTGIKTILLNDARFDVIGDFKHFSTARSLLSTLRPQLFVIDLTINEEAGYDVAQFLKKSNPNCKVAIVTQSKEEFHIVNAVQEGIDAYIHKDSEPDELLLGLSRIVGGQKYYSVEISTILVNSAYRRQSKGVPFLTTKEKEIIRLLMDGFSSKQIAARLDVSPRTIHSHRANILGKFNLNNTTQLVTKIAEQKIHI
jgi:DNA-binding NarL/FixJ family response regulator